MSDIKLNLINNSEDENNTDYVLYQQNTSIDTRVQSVAWKIIKSLGIGSHHHITYPMEFQVGAIDANGNCMPLISAEKGSRYEMVLTNSGHEFSKFETSAANPLDVEIWNNLKKGSMDAQIYRGGGLLATKLNIMPGSKANFQFKPILFIGAVSQITEGKIMSSNVTVQYLTKLNLQNTSHTDIIISGGGKGTEATPLTFTLMPSF